MQFFEVKSVPDLEFDKTVLFDSIGDNPILIVYDIEKVRTYIGVGKNSTEYVSSLGLSVPGLSLSNPFGINIDKGQTILSFYRKADTVNGTLFTDLFDISAQKGMLIIAFIPMEKGEIEKSKLQIEQILSKRHTAQTISTPADILGKRFNTTFHSESFSNSEEAMMLEEVLESINRSILRNGVCYKMFFATSSQDVKNYLKSRFLVLSSQEIKVKSTEDLLSSMAKSKAFPIGVDIAGRFLQFRGVYSLGYVLPTLFPSQNGELSIGTYMKGAVSDTKKKVNMDPSALNLGFIITGLPGSGKTNEAMSIVESAKKATGTKLAVISPTDEWGSFAARNSMDLIRLYDGKTPINFFECPRQCDTVKFYEDLAMILSSASSAGPYRNPMEKCMLNAFRKVYSKTKTPDPIAVYEAIEEAVAKLHAKKTPSGYKHTKHGENIHSALENLRAILSRPEYCVEKGIDIGELLGNGAVFDLSKVSNSTKPYLYALILNQLYSVASTFDMNNDSKLRLLICLEEAQLIFGDEDAAAVQDMKYRIQDFRKQGIGLMLLTHNISDIEPSIRRLCQIKLYLKQAPDVAPIAAKDLVFTYAEDDKVVSKLKHLDSRVGAFSYVVKEGTEKFSNDTIFVRTIDYANVVTKIEPKPINCNAKIPRSVCVQFAIEARVSEDVKRNVILPNLSELKVFYLGDEVANMPITETWKRKAEGLIEGKSHKVQFIDRKGKVLAETSFTAKEHVSLKLNDDKLEVL